MDALLEPLRDFAEGQIDFRGQHLTELLNTLLLGLTAVVAFFVGFVSQDVFQTVWIGLAGAILTSIVVVPPWPFYNKHPETWLRSSSKPATGPAIMVDGVQLG